MPESPPIVTPRRPRRRWLLGALVLGCLLVAAGPTLVSVSPLPDALLADALPPSAGRLSAGSVGLSWTGPIEVTGLRLVDSRGERLFAAERVVLAGGLIGLLGGDGAPLDVLVERPRAELVVGPRGTTNFDAVLQAAQEKASAKPEAASQAKTAKARRPIAVRVVDGAALVQDATSGTEWLIEQVRVDVDDPAQGIDAITVDATGTLAAKQAGAAPGARRSGFTLRLGPAEGGGRIVEATANGVPLALVAPLLRKGDPTIELTGRADLEGRAAWKTPGGAPASDLTPGGVVRLLAAGGFRSTGLARLSGAGFTTSGHSVALGSVEAPWRVAAAGDGLQIQQLDVTTTLGRAVVTGAVASTEVERWAAGVAATPRDLRVEGHVDLDRLAVAAPGVLRLQQGVQLQSGRLQGRVEFTAGRLAAKLESGPLVGLAGNRTLRWEDPLTLRFAALQRAPAAGLSGWELERLIADSSFFNADATGNQDQLRGNLNFDLTKLSRQLTPLIDLRGVRLAGSGNAQFEVSRNTQTGAWRLDSTGSLRQLLVGDPERPFAREPGLEFAADLDGRLTQPATPPTGTIRLAAGEDRLVVRLTRAEAAGVQPFEASVSGDIARWFRRAKTALPNLPAPEQIKLAGDLDLSAAGVAGSAGGRLDRFNLALKRLGIDTADLPGAPPVRLAGERVELSGNAEWDAQRGAARIAEATLVSSVASARLNDGYLVQGEPADSRGEVLFRADLAQLARWFPGADGAAPQYAAAGVVEGSANVRGDQVGASLRLETRGTNLSLTDRVQRAVVWNEPALQFLAEATVTPTLAVEVRNARVESQTLTGSFGGRIADAANLRGVELTGGVDYDLERLTPVLLPSLGNAVRLVGRDRATFRLQTDDSAPAGSAAITRLRGSVTAPWRSAEVFGLAVGPGRVAATLDRGTVRLEPLDVSVGGGRLTAEAAASLDPAPPVLSLREGPLLTNIAMSREVNERVLKFIAPVLADATRIEGRYSLALADFAVPLTTPPANRPPPGRASGVLDIHQVRVTPGPSVEEQVALVRQIVGLARDGVQSVARARETTLIAIEQSRVNFQLVDGRVYHNGLTFYVGDARVESAGSVGVDETLNLVLSVPILDEWIARQPTLLGRLRGQALRIPVTGTLQRPKVDRNAFEQLSRGLVGSALEGAVEEGINRLFDKLRSR